MTSHIVEGHIKGFFGNIVHDWLIGMLEDRINDNLFLLMIQNRLTAGLLDTSGKVIHPVTGTPHGDCISYFSERVSSLRTG